MKDRKRHISHKAERNHEILKRALAGEKLSDIAKDYDITAGCIGQIVQREKRFIMPDNHPGGFLAGL